MLITTSGCCIAACITCHGTSRCKQHHSQHHSQMSLQVSTQHSLSSWQHLYKMSKACYSRPLQAVMLKSGQAFLKSCRASQDPRYLYTVLPLRKSSVSHYCASLSAYICLAGVYQAEPTVVHGLPNTCIRHGSSLGLTCPQPSRL